MDANNKSSNNATSNAVGVNMSGTEDDDTLLGTQDNDTLMGLAGDDSIEGLAGDDNIDGGIGHDTLIGGDGNDTLEGGFGKDILHGGSGNDFLSDPSEAHRFLYVDDPSEGDRPYLDYAIFSGKFSEYTLDPSYQWQDEIPNVYATITDSVAGRDGEDTISGVSVGLFDSTFVSIDTDKGGYRAAWGTDDADTLDAGRFVGYIYGYGGDDLIISHSNGTVQGGDGNDTIEVTPSGVFYDEYYYQSGIQGGNGTDTARFSGNREDYEISQAVDFAGNSFIKIVEDTGQANFADLYSIERLEFDDGSLDVDQLFPMPKEQTGNDSDDILTGSTGNDSINGNSGNDRLFGYRGNDTLLGGDGDDFLSGGFGADHVDGGAGNDTARIYNNPQNYTISGTADNFTLTFEPEYGPSTEKTFFNVENLSFQKVETTPQELLDGVIHRFDTYGSDNFDGGFLNDLLDGGQGHDVLTGRGGDDTLIGGSGYDTAVFIGNRADYDIETEGSGENIRFVAVTHRDGGDQGRDSLQSIERLEFDDQAVTLAEFWPDNSFASTLRGNIGEDSLIGSNAANQIFGEAGGDHLEGNGGDDFIDGGAGNDTLIGGQGDDTLIGRSGFDQLEGGQGNDMLYGYHPEPETEYRRQSQAVFTGDFAEYDIQYEFSDDSYEPTIVTVTDTVAGRDGTDTLFDIDSAIFNGISITFPGSPESPPLAQGSNGDDIIDVGTAMNVEGNYGNDHIVAYGGEYIRADNGDDTIDATGEIQGLSVNGGSGIDTIRFSGRLNNYNVTFESIYRPYDVRIERRNADTGEYETVASIGDVEYAQFGDTRFEVSDINDGGALVGQGSMGDDVLWGTSQNADHLFGHHGNDHIFGLEGDDTLNGGDGNDLLFGGADDDLIIGGDGIDEAYYNLAKSNFEIAGKTDSFTVTHKNGGKFGTDTLQGVEKLRFNGVTYQVADLLPRGKTQGVNYTDSDVGRSWTGTVFSETLNGRGGNDTLIGNGGNDVFIGGDGFDSLEGQYSGDIDHLKPFSYAVYRGNLSDYEITSNVDSRSKSDDVEVSVKDTVGGRDRDDTLKNIQVGQFNGTFVNIGEIFNSKSNAKITAWGTQGDDILDVDRKSVDIYGYGGNDLIVYQGRRNVGIAYGGEGDDTIAVRPETTYGEVHGDAGFDTARFLHGGDHYDVRPWEADDDGNVQIRVYNNNVQYQYSELNSIEKLEFTDQSTTVLEMKDSGQVQVGTDAADTLTTTAANDLVKANGGDDLIHASKGFDRIFGGDGNDTLVFTGRVNDYDVGYDDVSENSSNGQPPTSEATIDSIEYLKIGATTYKYSDFRDGGALTGYGTDRGETHWGSSDHNDHLIGRGGDDNLFGLEGRDTLEGGDGNDLLFGGADNDVIKGGDGHDEAYYNNAIGEFTIEGTTDRFTVSHNDGGKFGIDTLTGVEKLRFNGVTYQVSDLLEAGTDRGVDKTGTEGDDTLVGTEYDDTLTGRGGNDLLVGNGGDDIFNGGAGDDVIEGQYTGISRSENGPHQYAVYQGDFHEYDVVSNSDPNFPDRPLVVTVTDEVANRDGSDTLNGVDVANFNGTFVNIEFDPDNYADPISYLAWGTDGDDTLFTGRGMTSFDGLGGNDLILNTGTSTFGSVSGGDGDDTVTIVPIYADRDVASGDAGYDTARFSGNRDQYEISLRRVEENGDMELLVVERFPDGEFGEAEISAFERLEFADQTVEVTDLFDRNQFQEGGDGNDTLTGTAKNDRLAGNGGRDRLSGNRGHDFLSGGDGKDTLSGNQGNDTLDGGAGRDIATFRGKRHQYTFETDGERLFIDDTVSGRDGRDELLNIDKVRFGAKLYDIQSLLADATEIDSQQLVATSMDVGAHILQASVSQIDLDIENSVTLLRQEMAQFNAGDGDLSGIASDDMGQEIALLAESA